MPTRAQIEATVALPTYSVQVHNGSSWVTVGSQYIVSIQGDSSTSLDHDNPLGFGDNSEQSVTITTTYDFPYDWLMTPVRVYLGFAGSNDLVFSGYIESRTRNDYICEFTCSGLIKKIQNTKIYTDIFIDRAVTETTSTSIENPANANYKAGIVNYILWNCGGRPYEQASSYTNAVFYYSCQPAIITPRYTWVNGENVWDELLRLVRVCGGQIYQDNEGVIRYINPLSYNNGSSIYTFDTSKFYNISEDTKTEQYLNEVRCNYTPRYKGATQQVYEESVPRLINPLSSLDMVAETESPVFSVIFDYKGAESTVLVNFKGVRMVKGTDYTISDITTSAQRVTFKINNLRSEPIILHKVTLHGEPLLSSDQKSYIYGSGDPSKQIEDSIYIQNEYHAERLTLMVRDFYGVARPIITLEGCGYDPDRYLGELVNLTYSPWGLSSVKHRIVQIEHDGTGTTMTVKLVPVSDLPTYSNFFIVGNSYNGSDSRKLGY